MSVSVASPETIIDKLPLPPPLAEAQVPADEAEEIPGEIKLDKQGKLMKKYITYSGFAGYLGDAANHAFQVEIPAIVATTRINMDDGSYVTFDPRTLYWNPPTYEEKGEQKPLYPDLCRKRSLTYGVDMYFDMVHVSADGTKYLDKPRRKYISYMPIPLKCFMCYTNGKDDAFLKRIGEDPVDPGGYWIVNGREKVVLIQEMLRTNKILINKTSKGVNIASMTCETPQGSKMVNLTVNKAGGIDLVLSGFKLDSKKEYNRIGVMRAFRMLGFGDPQKLANLILTFTKAKNNLKLANALAISFVELERGDANSDFIELGAKIKESYRVAESKKSAKKKGKKTQRSDEPDFSSAQGQKDYILNVLHNELFPFVNHETDDTGANISRKYKLLLLAMMVAQLSEVLIGVRAYSDKDSWTNKRLRVGASTYSQLFRMAWVQTVNKLNEELLKTKNITFERIYQTLKVDDIRNTFLDSFQSNSWGIKDTFARQNVTQLLKRDSLIQTLSHLTQIDVSRNRNDKNHSIRMVQNSQYGLVCCLTGETEILLADGKTLCRIDQLEGKEVTTVDITTLENSSSAITNYYSLTPERLLKITTIDRQSVKCTPEHPFLTLVDGYHKWVHAGALRIGNKLITTSGSPSRALGGDKYWSYISSIEDAKLEMVYDFKTVSGHHSFIANGFVTHNCVETPEGENTGVIKNLTAVAKVTVDKSETFLRNTIKSLIFPSLKANTTIQTKVVVNGKMLGWCDGPATEKILRSMKTEKNPRGSLPETTSIVYTPEDDYLYIYSDGSRVVKPVLRVNIDTQKLIIQEKQLWGAPWAKLMEEGCIEYLDAWEQEHMHIATQLTDLDEPDEYRKTLMELARGFDIEPNVDAVEQHVRKRRFTHCELDPTSLFGYGAAMIPLPNHAQAPRNVYQVQMSKQALGLYHSNMLNRFDGTIKTLAHPTRAVFEPQMAGVIGFNDHRAGEMVMMAFIPYTGFTQEDSFVFNRGSLERGLFMMVKYSVYKTTVKDVGVYREHLRRPKPKEHESAERYIALDENGLPIIGTKIKPGYYIIGKEREYKDGRVDNVSEVMGIGEEGVIDAVFKDTNPSTGEITIQVRIRDVRTPVEGDKFAPRQAQKGTNGLSLNEEDMPFVEQGAALYRASIAENGEIVMIPAPRPDVLVNPLCIHSRMTMNYVIEIMASNVGVLKGQRINATAFRPFNEIDYSQVLRDYGFQPYSTVQMYSGLTGKPMKVPIYFGPCYWQALKHHVKDKYQARQCGGVKAATRTPVGGRRLGGGIRFNTPDRVGYKPIVSAVLFAAAA